MAKRSVVMTEDQRDKLLACIDTQLRKGEGGQGGAGACLDAAELIKLLTNAPIIKEKKPRKAPE